jgi:PEP-CTERM motif
MALSPPTLKNIRFQICALKGDNMTRVKILAALVLAAGSLQAADAAISLGTIVPGQSYVLGDTPAVGPFSDTYTFTLATASSLTDGILSAGLNPLSVLLETAGGISVGSVPVTLAGVVGSGLQTFNNLAAGDYQLIISGFSNPTTSVFGNSGFYGDVLATPVPEADTWLMMIIGAGLIGFQLRRKHQALPPSTITAS